MKHNTETKLSRRAFSLALGALGPLSLLKGGETFPDPFEILDRPPNYTLAFGTITPRTSQDFLPQEEEIVERPLLSEIVRNSSQCEAVKTHLKNVYSTIALGKTAGDSPHMLDIWEHADACDPLGEEDDVHMTRQFLPWHRGFIYFHERMIRHVCNLPKFRLPVWDWEAAGNETIPAPYAQWNNSLPLAASIDRTVTKLPRPFSSDDLQAWMLSAPSNLWEFIGHQHGSKIGKASSGAPHMLVHQSLIGMMSNLEKAPADPLFFAHHANVDRCWTKWIEYYSTTIKQNREFQPWLDSKLHFRDHVTRTVVPVSVRSLLFDNWGYKYKPLDLELYQFQSVNVQRDTKLPGGLVDLKDSDLTRILEGVRRQVKTMDGGIDLSKWSDTQRRLKTALDQGARFSLPVQLTLSNPNLLDGHYAVGVQRTGAPNEEPLILGEFAILDPGHGHARHVQSYIVTGSISREAASDLLGRLKKASNSATFRVVYGQADTSGPKLKIKGGSHYIKPLNLSRLEIRYPAGNVPL